jgi:glycosyltransferase involved in cell wall biosynthesis
MRALVLTQIVPHPADAGPKIKTQYALRTLAQEHAIEVLSFARSDEETRAARELETWCERVTAVPLRRRKALEPYYAARGWATGQPFLVQRDARREFAARVRARLAVGDIDVLHADQLTMAQYLPLARGTRARTVFDAHNAVWQLVRDMAASQTTPWRRAAAQVEWRLLRRFEGAAARDSDLLLAVSADDARALAEAAGQPCRTVVTPIGVEAQERQPVCLRDDACALLSIATMHYPPNADAIRWFRDAVWPLIRGRSQDATVEIVGARSPGDIAEWADSDERVMVHGYVADVNPFCERAAAFIVPLWAGSGVRVKVLEALASGLPVVSTSIGVEGLDLVPDKHLLVADDAESFARATLSLLASPRRRAELAAAGRARVLERYDWRVCCRPLLTAYQELERLDVARDGGRRHAVAPQLPAHERVPPAGDLT